MGELTPVGSFEEQVMLGVLPTGDEAYGMAVRREIEQVTGRDVAIGAVSATLDRLESKGYVSSSRGSQAASRRVFKLTRAGLRALADTREARANGSGRASTSAPWRPGGPDDARSQLDSLNSTDTDIRTSTGTPFSSVGSNRH